MDLKIIAFPIDLQGLSESTDLNNSVPIPRVSRTHQQDLTKGGNVSSFELFRDTCCSTSGGRQYGKLADISESPVSPNEQVDQ